MKLRFSKMHGLGNDFVVIDACSQQVALTPQQIRRIADRHFGVGCDQLLRRECNLLRAGVDDNEVVAQAMHFAESEFHGSAFMRAVKTAL